MKLPSLPQPTPIPNAYGGFVLAYTTEQVRVIQMEAARAALEEATKLCDLWKTRNFVYVNGALRCGEDIRAIQIKE